MSNFEGPPAKPGGFLFLANAQVERRATAAEYLEPKTDQSPQQTTTPAVGAPTRTRGWAAHSLVLPDG